MSADASPLVRKDGWGFVEVEGLGRLRDAKLWPGGGRGWDWNETGTHHRPGIQAADVAELLDRGADVVVLSRGRELRLETTSETLSLLAERWGRRGAPRSCQLACARPRLERSTMPVTTRHETVTAFEGGTFDAYCAVLQGEGPRPGVVLFQEIFGINDNMRGLAEKMADAGYVALVPDMFWRLEPGFERKDESGLADGMALVQQFDWEGGGADIASTLAHLRAMPECNGRVGGVGFCFGGVLAYLFAATARPDGNGPDAAVSYYGSGVHGMLHLAERIECPIMFHYGTRDPFIPGEQIDQVEAALAGRADVEFHRHDAGHAFSNWDAPSMYDQPAADEAWGRTLDFFARHLGA